MLNCSCFYRIHSWCEKKRGKNNTSLIISRFVNEEKLDSGTRKELPKKAMSRRFSEKTSTGSRCWWSHQDSHRLLLLFSLCSTTLAKLVMLTGKLRSAEQSWSQLLHHNGTHARRFSPRPPHKHVVACPDGCGRHTSNHKIIPKQAGQSVLPSARPATVLKCSPVFPTIHPAERPFEPLLLPLWWQCRDSPCWPAKKKGGGDFQPMLKVITTKIITGGQKKECWGEK